jgi:hypothetical protein
MLFVLPGCLPEADVEIPDEEAWRPVQLIVTPDTAAPGLARFVEILGFGARWEEGVEVDFGDDVDVFVSRVQRGSIRAQIIPHDDAPVGRRDLFVRQGPNVDVLREALTIQSGVIEIVPSTVALGQTTDLQILGSGTSFQSGWTTVSLGESIEIKEVRVVDAERIFVTVHVPHRAESGHHDVFAYNPGGDTWTLHRGLLVDRDTLEMSIVPDVADQGEVLNVRVTTEGTKLSPTLTELDLGTGVVIESWDVISANTVEARLRIGNNAMVGSRDVKVSSTPIIGDAEVRYLLDGFEIRAVDADVLRARASISFGASRTFQVESCDFRTTVYAAATFYEPNDFPCPSTNASSTLSVPPHFDLAGSGFSVNPGGSTDCPPSKTFDAGPYIELVSDVGTIELERLVTDFTGRISYRALDLDISDYALDQMWGLETPGGDLGYSELPAWSLPYVLHTLKVDYQQHQPNYCALVHPLDEPLDVVWDPALTYDDAEMYLYMIGPDQDEGVPIMMLYPWDDGAFSYDAETLGFFTDGYASLLQSAYRQTRFEVPGSELINAGFGTSNLLWRGEFEFE